MYIGRTLSKIILNASKKYNTHSHRYVITFLRMFCYLVDHEVLVKPHEYVVRAKNTCKILQEKEGK